MMILDSVDSFLLSVLCSLITLSARFILAGFICACALSVMEKIVGVAQRTNLTFVHTAFNKGDSQTPHR